MSEDVELKDNHQYSIVPELTNDGCLGIAYADEPLAEQSAHLLTF